MGVREGEEMRGEGGGRGDRGKAERREREKAYRKTGVLLGWDDEMR